MTVERALALLEARDKRQAGELQNRAWAAYLGQHDPKGIEKIKPRLGDTSRAREYQWWKDGPPSE